MNHTEVVNHCNNPFSHLQTLQLNDNTTSSPNEINHA